MRNFRSPALHVEADAIVDGEGNRVVLRGVGLGGWMNMENFITGYPATRARCGRRCRPCSARSGRERLFRPPAHRFFAEQDAALLAGSGLNFVRIP